MIIVITTTIIIIKIKIIVIITTTTIIITIIIIIIIDRDTRKLISGSGGNHPKGSIAALYLTGNKGGRGLKSLEEEYKNITPLLKMRRDLRKSASCISR